MVAGFAKMLLRREAEILANSTTSAEFTVKQPRTF